jgi:hypothetical protein
MKRDAFAYFICSRATANVAFPGGQRRAPLPRRRDRAFGRRRDPELGGQRRSVHRLLADEPTLAERPGGGGRRPRRGTSSAGTGTSGTAPRPRTSRTRYRLRSSRDARGGGRDSSATGPAGRLILGAPCSSCRYYSVRLCADVHRPPSSRVTPRTQEDTRKMSGGASTTVARRTKPGARRGTAASPGRRPDPERRGSRRPARARAPTSGGRARTSPSDKPDGLRPLRHGAEGLVVALNGTLWGDRRRGEPPDVPLAREVADPNYVIALNDRPLRRHRVDVRVHRRHEDAGAVLRAPRARRGKAKKALPSFLDHVRHFEDLLGPVPVPATRSTASSRRRTSAWSTRP